MNMTLSDQRTETYGEGNKSMEQKRKKRKVLTTPLDWELDIRTMAEDIHFLVKAMVRIQENNNAALLQFVLLLKSLKIQKKFMTLVIRILNKAASKIISSVANVATELREKSFGIRPPDLEYASEQEEREALNMIWDLKMEHMELITDARVDLNNKRTNRGSDELSKKMGNDKRKKKQRKIEKLAKEDGNNIIDDGKQLVQCVEKLQELQEELEKINEEASSELLKVAQKYSRICKPVYEKRTDIIKDIPGFWSTAFLKHPILGGLVSTEEDRKILEFLSSIEVEQSNDVKSGYTITFCFEPNVYFANTKLWKTYTFVEDDGHTKITASSILWAEGKGVDDNSFFRWFNKVNKRDEISELIKDDLWSDPLTCFHHEAKEEGDDDVAVNDKENEVVKDTEDEGQDEEND